MIGIFYDFKASAAGVISYILVILFLIYCPSFFLLNIGHPLFYLLGWKGMFYLFSLLDIFGGFLVKSVVSWNLVDFINISLIIWFNCFDNEQ